MALLVIAAELVLGWFTYDLATAISRHLEATRPVQWFFLMLPFLPLALVVAVRALSPARGVAAGLMALGAGAVLIAHNEFLRWVFEHQVVNPSYQEMQTLGYAAVMAASVLAALAWGLSRRHGRTWPLGLLVAAAGAALTIRTNWTAHTPWGRTVFVSLADDHNPIRRAEVMHTVAVMLPVVAACVVCWLIDVAELRRTPPDRRTTKARHLGEVTGLRQAVRRDYSPARVKPAASADSTESNHTSATVCSNH